MVSAYAEQGKRLVSWWGKLIGGSVGFVVAQLPGMLFGFTVGHLFDRAQRLGHWGLPRLFRRRVERHERAHDSFFQAVFAVMGHLAKSKGRVTEADIAAARAVMEHMGLSAERRKEAITLFGSGKRPDFPLDATLDRLRQEGGQHGLLRMFLELLLEIAYADGEMAAVQRRLLERIRARLAFPLEELEQMEALVRAERGFAAKGDKGGKAAGAEQRARREWSKRGRQAGGERQQRVPGCTPLRDDPYSVLGLAATASDAEVKQTYRRLLSQHHPDKVMAQGLPPEAVKLATHKTHEIKSAYDRIRSQRGF